MNNALALAFTPVFLLCAVTSAAAQDSRLAGGVGVGTTGITLEAKAKLTGSLVARGGYDFLQFDIGDQSYDDVDYNVDLDFSTVSVFVDFHPFQSAFNVSAGLFFGSRSIDLFASPTGNVDIGGQTFTAAQVGNITGQVSTNDVAPYLGVGWDNAFTTDSRWSFFVRAGVIVSDSPNVELASVGGTLSTDALLIAELEAEEANVESEINDYKYYPVVAAGASLKF